MAFDSLSVLSLQGCTLLDNLKALELVSDPLRFLPPPHLFVSEEVEKQIQMGPAPDSKLLGMCFCSSPNETGMSGQHALLEMLDMPPVRAEVLACCRS